jgi:purine-binding chemotaxis protein CheW
MMDQPQYLTFQIAGEEYAIDILSVREIIPSCAITAVPQTPPAIRGMINLRGNVVPVVDLAIKLGFAPTPITNRTCIVVLEVALDEEPIIVGVLVDSVNQVIEFLTENILPVPAFGTQVRIDFLAGMGNSGVKFVLILDIEKVLGATEMIGAQAGANPADSIGKPVKSPSVPATRPGLKPAESPRR